MFSISYCDPYCRKDSCIWTVSESRWGYEVVRDGRSIVRPWNWEIPGTERTWRFECPAGGGLRYGPCRDPGFGVGVPRDVTNYFHAGKKGKCGPKDDKVKKHLTNI